jgi:hypothetical protein
MARYAVSGEGILDIVHKFTPMEGQETVNVRIDRNSASLPFVYAMAMK